MSLCHFNPKFLPVEIEIDYYYVKVLRYSTDFMYHFRTWEGSTPAIIIADPDLLKEVCIRKFHCFKNRRVRNNANLFSEINCGKSFIGSLKTFVYKGEYYSSFATLAQALNF